MKAQQTAKRSSEPPMVYTIGEAARILKISPRLIERELSEGKLKGARLGRRRIVIPRFEIDRYLHAAMHDARTS
jgi:excisionase family DNA binding protein